MLPVWEIGQRLTGHQAVWYLLLKRLTYYLRPLTQEVTLMSQTVVSAAMTHYWAQVIVHSCPTTHTEIGTFFGQTNCFKSEPADTDKSRQWNKRWQPQGWSKQRQPFPATSGLLLRLYSPFTLQRVNLQVKAGACQRQRKTKTVLSNMFSLCSSVIL